MLNLTAVSLFCVVVLVALFLYSGSLLPATQGADSEEATRIWIMWGVTVAVPLMTAALWVLRLIARSGD